MRSMRQSRAFGAGPATLANIAKLRAGARAVVTGQQVVLLGGPLLTLLKAATAIARAKQATAATGIEHVPIFWLATEDHDLEEVDQVSLLSKNAVETLRLEQPSPHAAPVGNISFDVSINALLDRASELLHHAPICDLLRECYAHQPRTTAAPTFASAFARLMTRLFAEPRPDRDGRLGPRLPRARRVHAAIRHRARRGTGGGAAGAHGRTRSRGLPRAGAGQAGSVAALSDQRGRRRAESPGPAPPARRKLEGRSRQLRRVLLHRRAAGDSRLRARAAQPQRAPARRLSGHDSAHHGLHRRAGRGRVLRAERRALPAHSGPHHADPAAPVGHADRAGHRRDDGAARGQPARRDAPGRGTGPATGRARPAHRGQAPPGRCGQRAGCRR